MYEKVQICHIIIILYYIIVFRWTFKYITPVPAEYIATKTSKLIKDQELHCKLRLCMYKLALSSLSNGTQMFVFIRTSEVSAEIHASAAF